MLTECMCACLLTVCSRMRVVVEAKLTGLSVIKLTAGLRNVVENLVGLAEDKNVKWEVQ